MKEEHIILNEYWNNLHKFNDVNEIPSLPTHLTELHIQKLIEAGAITKKNLVNGKSYIGKCRNAEIAIWNELENTFIYKRYKFDIEYDEKINHFEDDDGFDLFIPIQEL
ncbi:hypothetical protein M0Q50_06645 [bacterium]|jgi:hypothetical protein|nr:hypothetical protein [bacterium]